MAYKRILSFLDEDYRTVRTITVTAQTSADLAITSARCGERRPGERYIFTNTREIPSNELPTPEGGPALGTLEPLNIGFNAAVMTIANRLFPAGYDIGPNAPQTLEELNDHIARTGRMLVWDGASDETIFGCPEHNWAFRAWHDWVHWKYQLPFTLEGESAVAEIQKSHIVKLFGRGREALRYCRLIDCEVVGQALHKIATGVFPADQRAFAKSYLEE